MRLVHRHPMPASCLPLLAATAAPPPCRPSAVPLPSNPPAARPLGPPHFFSSSTISRVNSSAKLPVSASCSAAAAARTRHTCGGEAAGRQRRRRSTQGGGAARPARPNRRLLVACGHRGRRRRAPQTPAAQGRRLGQGLLLQRRRTRALAVHLDTGAGRPTATPRTAATWPPRAAAAAMLTAGALAGTAGGCPGGESAT